MVFLRPRLLIVCVLLLGGGPLLAAGGTREQRAYAAAVAPFHDGLWNYAATNLVQFLGKYPDSSNAPAAVLLLAQAEFNLGEFSQAMTTLKEHQSQAGGLADQYVYWTGEAQSANSNFMAAADAFVALTKDFPQSPLCLSATIEAAAAYAQLGDWPQHDALLENPNGAFGRAAQLDPANQLVLVGQLLREKSKYQQRDFPGVLGIYGWLTNHWQVLNQEQQGQATYLYHLANMELGDFTTALAAATNLAQLARSPANPDWLATAWVAQGAALKSLGRTNEAIAAYQQNLTNAPVKQQREAILKIAELKYLQGELADAQQSLTNFLAQFPDSVSADIALLTLGELHLKTYVAQPADTNQLAAAQLRFAQFIGAFANSPLAGRAYLDRGWCGWLTGNMTNSLADFEAAVKALQSLPPSEDLAVARFKTGDAMFALTNYAGALENYRAVLNDFAGFPGVAKSLGAPALFQILRANIELNDTDHAAAAMRQLLQQFPTNPLAEQGSLLAGQALSVSDEQAKAREIFQQFTRQYPDSPLKPQVDLAVARTFEYTSDWPAAITNYEGWLKDNPTNNLLPQVQYALGRAYYHAGQETNAFELFTTFVTRFPTDPNAPLAQWWVADHFFRLGGTNLVAAEQNYELIFQTPVWKSSRLFYPAQLMASRAALGRQDYPDAANNYLIKLVNDTNCPAALKTQAMFAYGGVLKLLDSADTNRPFANFELATNIFAQICRDNPTNAIGALAFSELGDCCGQQLSAFDAATNAYAQVVSSPAAGVGLRSRAQVGWGRVLEKMADADTTPPEARKPLRDLALQKYLDVFGTSYGKDLNDDESADAFWVKKAGLQALPLLSADNCPTNFFARMESLLPPLTDSLEKKKAALAAAKN